MADRGGPDPIDVAVGARICIQRRWRDLSQTALADALGITFQQVQKYEKGTNRVSASMLVKAAATLGTTVGSLVGEDGSAEIESVIVSQLSVPGAMELLSAFDGIADAEARRSILTLAASLGRSAGKAAA